MSGRALFVLVISLTLLFPDISEARKRRGGKRGKAKGRQVQLGRDQFRNNVENSNEFFVRQALLGNLVSQSRLQPIIINRNGQVFAQSFALDTGSNQLVFINPGSVSSSGSIIDPSSAVNEKRGGVIRLRDGRLISNVSGNGVVLDDRTAAELEQFNKSQNQSRRF